MAVLIQNLNRVFVLFELTSANKISFLDSYKKPLRKYCIDPLRPPGLSECGFLVRQSHVFSLRIIAELGRSEGEGLMLAYRVSVEIVFCSKSATFGSTPGSPLANPAVI